MDLHPTSNKVVLLSDVGDKSEQKGATLVLLTATVSHGIQVLHLFSTEDWTSLSQHFQKIFIFNGAFYLLKQ